MFNERRQEEKMLQEIKVGKEKRERERGERETNRLIKKEGGE